MSLRDRIKKKQATQAEGHMAHYEVASSPSPMDATEYDPTAEGEHASLDALEDALAALDKWEAPTDDALAKQVRKKVTMAQFTIRSDVMHIAYLRGLPESYPKWVDQYVEDGILPKLEQLHKDGILHTKASKQKQSLMALERKLPPVAILQWQELSGQGLLFKRQTALIQHWIEQGYFTSLPEALSYLYPSLVKRRLTDQVKADFSGQTAKAAIMAYCNALVGAMLELEDAGLNPAHELWPPSTLAKGARELEEFSRSIGAHDIIDLDVEDL